MVLTCINHALLTRVHRLPDGRRVTIRHAVPSDAPRLVSLSSEPIAMRDVITCDDRGEAVGRAGEAVGVEIADDWTASGLDRLLERELSNAG